MQSRQTRLPSINVSYVEDGDFHYGFFPVLKNGLDDGSGRVKVSHFPDFDIVLDQIDRGKLSDIYILDNEIYGSETIYGADVALRIKSKAKELGIEVLVLSLLSSNPGGIEKQYGVEFKQKNIPILFKLSHAAICAFFVGRCIKENKALDFQLWIAQEGITLPDISNIRANRVQGGLLAELELDKGFLYYSPGDYIREHLSEITKYMRSEVIRELHNIFSINLGSGIERRR